MQQGGMLAFPKSEYEGRLARVRAEMERRGIEILIVDETEALGWLTGFQVSLNRYRACLVPIDAAPVMLLRKLDVAAFLEQTWLEDYVGYADDRDEIGAIAEVLRARGWDRRPIGLDKASYALSVQRHEALGRALEGSRWLDFTSVIREIMLIKSPAEIAMLRKAAGIADQAMKDAIEAVGEGRTERDAAAAAAATFYRMGADNGRTGPITSGAEWGFLHGPIHDHPLQSGAIVHMELTPRLKGYSSRLMRPTVIGGPSDAQLAVADQLIEVQDRQIAAMLPGAPAATVDAICREGLIDAGLRADYDNTTGYTLGYYAESGPRTSDFTRVFNRGVDWVLEPAMCFHMYCSARGLAFSETVVVSETGPERLTRIERRVFSA